jgi:hypothetical protein
MRPTIAIGRVRAVAVAGGYVFDAPDDKIMWRICNCTRLGRTALVYHRRAANAIRDNKWVIRDISPLRSLAGNICTSKPIQRASRTEIIEVLTKWSVIVKNCSRPCKTRHFQCRGIWDERVQVQITISLASRLSDALYENVFHTFGKRIGEFRNFLCLKRCRLV